MTHPARLFYGKQVDLSGSSGPLHSPCERKHGCALMGRKGARLHKKPLQTQCAQDLLPANTVKVIMLRELGPRWGLLERPTRCHCAKFSTSQWRTTGAQRWRLEVPVELSLMDTQSWFSLWLWSGTAVSKRSSCYVLRLLLGCVRTKLDTVNYWKR